MPGSLVAVTAHHARKLARDGKTHSREAAMLRSGWRVARHRASGSFDHLVGGSEQCRGHVKTKRLCGLEVDHKLELVGLLHREIGRLSASKDAIDVLSSLSELVNGVDTDAGMRWRAASPTIRSR